MRNLSGSYHSIPSSSSTILHSTERLSSIHITNNNINNNEYIVSNDYYYHTNSNTIGLLCLLISALFAGFGNSLEMVSMLSWLSTVLLLVGLELAIINNSNNRDNYFNSTNMRNDNNYDIYIDNSQLWKVLLFIWITQSIGFTIGFSSIFSFPDTTFISILSTFIFGLGFWFVLIIFAIIPHIYFKQKYCHSIITIFVYPFIQTTITYSMIGLIFSTFTMIGNSSIDYEPLRQVASIFGIAGINFIFLFTGSFASNIILNYLITIRFFKNIPQRILSKQIKIMRFITIVLILISLFAITGILYQSDSIYQKDILKELKDIHYLPVSCVFGHSIHRTNHDWDVIWDTIKKRVIAGDQIILMSEETLEIYSDEDEVFIIKQAKDIANMQIDLSKHPIYIGISYLKFLSSTSDIGTNHFTLVSSTLLSSIVSEDKRYGKNETTSDSDYVLWNYKKANPVPLVESNIQAGPWQLPMHQSTSYGKLSGAICFDLDYPQYIAQAGQENVNLFLQPSWTWKAINFRHFDGNAIRAIENGFTLFRCSSDGESGIVNHKGKILARQYTGHDPTIYATFSLPIHPYDNATSHFTFFRFGFGIIFEYLCFICSIICILLSLLPRDLLLQRIQEYLPKIIVKCWSLLLLNKSLIDINSNTSNILHDDDNNDDIIDAIDRKEHKMTLNHELQVINLNPR